MNKNYVIFGIASIALTSVFSNAWAFGYVVCDRRPQYIRACCPGQLATMSSMSDIDFGYVVCDRRAEYVQACCPAPTIGNPIPKPVSPMPTWAQKIVCLGENQAKYEFSISKLDLPKIEGQLDVSFSTGEKRMIPFSANYTQSYDFSNSKAYEGYTAYFNSQDASANESARVMLESYRKRPVRYVKMRTEKLSEF
jgi:hypothetical protein